MDGPFAGFDWDEGNRSKCEKHGVAVDELESMFSREVMMLPDPDHSAREVRLRAIGITRSQRHVFAVFTVREKDGKRYIRPISARFMHRKEILHYEKENPGIQDRS